METRLIENGACVRGSHRRGRRVGALLLLVLQAGTARLQAQFNYTVALGEVTITKYTGPGGAVTIPDNLEDLPVTRIGAEAFFDGASVSSVTIPGTVTDIGDKAFAYCRGLTDVTIPDSVTHIGDRAFGDCWGLTRVTIGNRVSSIGLGAFRNCTRLTVIEVGSSNPAYRSLEGVLFNKTQTEVVHFPGGRVGAYTIPNSVTSIGGEAFFGCVGLTNIVIADGVTSIGDSAFYDCRSLTSITIPETVTSVGYLAFASCTDLVSAVIGDDVTSIGYGAFFVCTRLGPVYFLGNAPAESGSVFELAPDARVYHLPGTSGWGPTFAGRPTEVWLNPAIVPGTLGGRARGWGFTLSWEPGDSVVVEATSMVSEPNWTPVSTNLLTGGVAEFSDPDWANHCSRFYRLRSAPTSPVSPAGMVWIPPGTFTMGSPANEPDRWTDEGPQTLVTISRGFFLGKYEVTQREYLTLMWGNPSWFTGDLDRPVEQVSWNDAVAYCEKLTQQERAAGRLPAGYEYRLPTEAQWEYACRAGTTTATAFGNTLSSTQANFDGNSPYNGGAVGPYLWGTTKVGSYLPNAWGLYDMCGNVYEWCADWYSNSYPGGSVTDPTGPGSDWGCVMRGGGWFMRGYGCRSAHRASAYPSSTSSYSGFRAALVPIP